MSWSFKVSDSYIISFIKEKKLKKVFFWGQSNSTPGRAVALHAVNIGSPPSTPESPQICCECFLSEDARVTLEHQGWIWPQNKNNHKTFPFYDGCNLNTRKTIIFPIDLFIIRVFQIKVFFIMYSVACIVCGQYLHTWVTNIVKN